jgi:hypothetical protein
MPAKASAQSQRAGVRRLLCISVVRASAPERPWARELGHLVRVGQLRRGSDRRTAQTLGLAAEY